MRRKVVWLLLSAMLVWSGCIGDTDGAETKSKREETRESVVEDSEDESEEKVSKDVIEEKSEPILLADGLLDLFLSGEIPATALSGERESFYITDLPIDVEDYFSYSIGNRVDLDNDGEKELILTGPYGGMYLDAREGKVFVLAEGDGTAATLSYTGFGGQTWIVHSDVTHGGRQIYDLTLYDGKGQIVDCFRLSKEYWETPQEPDGPGTVYTYRDEEISKDEYDELYETIFPKSYFFPQGAESVTYTGSLWDSSEQLELEVAVAEVENFAEGKVYQLQIKCDKELQERWGVERLDLGLFLVMGDQIYKADVTKDAPYTVEDIISTGTLVCSKENKEDALGEEEKGWHEYIIADGNRVEYHGYNTLVETGYYERFIWEMGKGLVEYRSGYGAAADGMELYLVD